MTDYLDNRIESMLISRIAHYRLSIRTQFRNRHKVGWPELTYKTVTGDIRNLKVWMRMADLIQEGQNHSYQIKLNNENSTVYTIFLAKQLTS